MEYWVSHVKKKGNYITQVKAFFNTVEGLKNPNLFNREEIVRSIDEKDSLWFMCIFNEGISGKRIWEKGVRIHTVEVDGNKYIRTDGNRKESDNLGELPPINQEYKE